MKGISMRAGFRLSAATLPLVILAGGCATAVIETRGAAPQRRLAPARTLVRADVAEPDRSAIEDAVAASLRGVVAEHRVPATSVGETSAPSHGDWDTLILVKIADAKIQSLPEVSYTPDSFDGMPRLPTGGIPAQRVAWLYLDVSVQRFSDLVEIFGLTVRSDRALLPRATSGEEKKEATNQAVQAARDAARRLGKSGVFD